MNKIYIYRVNDWNFCLICKKFEYLVGFFGKFFFIVYNLIFRYKVICILCLIIYRFYIFLIIYFFFWWWGREEGVVYYLGNWLIFFKWGVFVCDKILFNLLICCICIKLLLFFVFYIFGIVKKYIVCNV